MIECGLIIRHTIRTQARGRSGWHNLRRLGRGRFTIPVMLINNSMPYASAPVTSAIIKAVREQQSASTIQPAAWE
ncbi:MAG: hypothetical protein VX738_14965 [Planctomycetota bacterium]|nr:hypothetical protein [Planctomycetota bacterium]